MFYSALTIWRGLACLWVFLFHASEMSNESFGELPAISFFLSYGYLGVQMFFVISGFCIANSIERASEWVELKRYAVKRFLRIYPPYFFSILYAVSLLLLAKFVNPENTFPESLWFWFSQLTLIQLLLGQDSFVSVYWSLQYEAQFYFVMAFVLMVGKRRNGFYLALFCLSVIWLITGYQSKGTIKWFFLSYWLQFYLGVLVYEVLNSKKKDKKQLIQLALYWIAIGLMAFIQNDLQLIFCFCFAGLLVLLGRLNFSIMQEKMLSPLFWLGAISYSLYLTHLPLLFRFKHFYLRAELPESPLFFLSLSTVICLVVAWLFYKVIEKPTQQYSKGYAN